MNQKLFRVLVFVFLVGISIVCASDFDKNIVNVSAIGEVSFQPNIAYLTVGVEDDYKNAVFGQSDTNRKVDAFVKEIKKLVKETDIKTSSIRIRKKYEYIDRKREFMGYEVSQMLNVTITDFKNIGLVMDIGVKNGFNVISTLTFSHTDYEKYKREALKIALLEAEKKAELIGETMGLKGLRASRIVEGGSSYTPYRENNEAMGRMALTSVADSQPTQVYTGDLKAVSNVNVDYTYSGFVNK